MIASRYSYSDVILFYIYIKREFRVAYTLLLLVVNDIMNDMFLSVEKWKKEYDFCTTSLSLSKVCLELH
jgi:hypothetical protein